MQKEFEYDCSHGIDEKTLRITFGNEDYSDFNEEFLEIFEVEAPLHPRKLHAKNSSDIYNNYDLNNNGNHDQYHDEISDDNIIQNGFDQCLPASLSRESTKPSNEDEVDTLVVDETEVHDTIANTIINSTRSLLKEQADNQFSFYQSVVKIFGSLPEDVVEQLRNTFVTPPQPETPSIDKIRRQCRFEHEHEDQVDLNTIQFDKPLDHIKKSLNSMDKSVQLF